MKKKATVTKTTKTSAPSRGSASARADWWSLLPLLLVAALFRLPWLDRAAFRADTIHFWDMAQQRLSFSDVWSRWMQIMGESAQFPLPAALAMVPASWFGLPISGFSVRLSDALFGIAAVGGAWLAGRMLGGRWFAWAFGLFIALNPLHIQLSREAYFYSVLVTGSFLLLACTIRALRLPGVRWTRGWVAIWIAGLFLAAYSHFTGWILAGLTVLAVALRLGLVRPPGTSRRTAVGLVMAAGALALPLTWLPWALPFTLKRLTDSSAKEVAIRQMGAVKTPVMDMLAGYAQKLMWGNTGWGTALLLAGALAGLLLLALGCRRGVMRWLGGLCLAGLASYLAIMKSMGMYEAVRHVIYLFPLLAIFVFYGLWSLPRLPGLRRVLPHGLRGRAALAVVALALIAQLPAAWASLRITGSPTPYKDIQAWANQNLAKGTPVLVDRWFEPWNELRIYPTTNLVFMFTQPNEPLDVFLQTRWRDGAENFLRDNPDAAYLEICKSYWPEPGVGPWTWTRSYFKHQHTIANVPGLVLRRRGQAFREDYDAADTNRVVVEMFYNTREDVLQMARAEGRRVQAWPGSGWTFVKSGPVGAPLQTQQFMNWRLMEGSAVLELHNVSEQTQSVRLVFQALPPQRGTTVSAGALGSFTFPAGRLSEWRTPFIELPPGQTNIVLRTSAMAPAPLLVQGWSVELQ